MIGQYASVEQRAEGEGSYPSGTSDTIDMDNIVDQILTKAVAGLNKTVEFTARQARKYVPVRQIFQRSRRGPDFERVSLRKGASSLEALTVFRLHAIDSRSQYERFQMSLERRHRISVPHVLLGPNGQTKMASRQVIGHANSEQPVFRKDGRNISGDFRGVENGRLVPAPYAIGNKTRPAGQVSYADQFLTARGLYELKHGGEVIDANTGRRRSYFARGGRIVSALRSGTEQEFQVGGALKNSIKEVYAIAAKNTGMIWGRVVAGGEQAPYARFQEFGSVHNRAHPFLRPALYEARFKLVSNVGNAISAGSMTSGNIKTGQMARAL